MGKPKAPYASVVHLKLLVELYARLKGIASYPQHITLKKYITSLENHLILDSIIRGKSRNFLGKLIGFPYQADQKDTEGLDTDKLDLISKKVIEHFDLKTKLNLISTEYPWSAISEAIKVPDYLEFKDFRYYKFLPEDKKQLVDGFVMRIVDELTSGKSDIATYNLYMWNYVDAKISIAILQINWSTKVVSYNYFEKIGGDWTNRVVMRSDIQGGENIKLYGASLFCDLVEEDPKRDYVRARIVLSAKDIDYPHSHYLKGVLSISGKSANRPLSGLIILKRQRSFYEALEVVKNEHLWDSALIFDLLDTRFEVNEDTINSISKLDSAETFKLVEQVHGAYVIGFISELEKNKGKLILFTCYIDSSGIVVIGLPNSDYRRCQILKDFVGENHICISSFSHQKGKPEKFDYKLKIIKQDGYHSKCKYLEGSYSSAAIHDITSGDIVFKKLDFASLEELEGFIKPKVIDFEDKTLEHKYIDLGNDLLIRLRELQVAKHTILSNQIKH